MEPVTEWIRHRFPTVGNVRPGQLEQLVKENQQGVLLLDVRSTAEYEVSHLQGAIRIDPDTNDMDHLTKELGLAGLMDKTVVCYCTAGYHGSEMAEKLQHSLTQGREQEGRGSPKVYNLEGGLAKWANERKPMVDSKEQPTKLVHPYNEEWAYLLQPEFRALSEAPRGGEGSPRWNPQQLVYNNTQGGLATWGESHRTEKDDDSVQELCHPSETE